MRLFCYNLWPCWTYWLDLTVPVVDFFRVCECKILWSMNRDGFTSSLLSCIPLAYFSCLLTLDPSKQCWIEQPFLSYLLLWSQRKWIYLIFIIQNVINYIFHCCSLPSWRSFSPFPFFFSLYQISISNVFPPHLVRWSCGNLHFFWARVLLCCSS